MADILRHDKVRECVYITIKIADLIFESLQCDQYVRFNLHPIRVAFLVPDILLLIKLIDFFVKVAIGKHFLKVIWIIEISLVWQRLDFWSLGLFVNDFDLR